MDPQSILGFAVVSVALALTPGADWAYSISAGLGRRRVAPAVAGGGLTRGAVVTKVGTSVEIRLKAQSGTGFSWVPKQWAALVTPMPPLRGNRAMPGGTQIQRFRFQARHAGTYPVSFSYDQPWRGGIKGARTKTFTIIVR